MLGGGGAWLFLNQNEPGPEEVAKNFVETIDDNDFSSADDMIHPDSPLDGAGDAADILIAVAGVGQAIEAVDISVPSTEILSQSDGRAIVETTVEVDLVLREPSVDIPLDMRTHNGSWHVWNVDVSV